jgi:hypothetical protein
MPPASGGDRVMILHFLFAVNGFLKLSNFG